jgi:hypothetical protein
MMVEVNTPIVMTKGYQGENGKIIGLTDSPYGLYILALERGLKIVAGSSAFSTGKEWQDDHGA